MAGGFVGTLVDHPAGRRRFRLGDAAAAGWWPVVNAGFQVLTSKLAGTEDPLTMHFYTGLVGTLLARRCVWLCPVDVLPRCAAPALVGLLLLVWA